MSAAMGLTTGAEIGFYFKFAPLQALSDPPAYADIVAANKLVDNDDTHFIGECTDIGGIQKTANTKEIGFFRAKVKRRIAGIPTFEDMTFQVAVDHSNSLTKAIRDARVGSSCELAVVWNTDTANAEAPVTATQVTVAYIRGELASTSVDPALDDETLMDVSVTPSEDVRWFDHS